MALFNKRLKFLMILIYFVIAISDYPHLSVFVSLTYLYLLHTVLILTTPSASTVYTPLLLLPHLTLPVLSNPK